MSNDRITLPPVDAQKTNMTCHFCIVGCGYHVYKWPENKEGGRAPNQNALGLDFRKQLPALGIRYAGDDKRGHRSQRHPSQHHDRSGQGVRREQRPGVHARREDGLLYVHGGWPDEGTAARPDAVHRRPMGGNQLGDRAGHLCRRTKADLDKDGPSGIVFSALTTVVPAVASKTPGVAAS